MNNFIDNHLGYPDSDYDDDTYGGIKFYHDEIIGSYTNGYEIIDNNYEQTDDEVRAEVRFAIEENLQYRAGNGYTQYYDCLKNYMNIGNPIINSIDFISLSKVVVDDNTNLWDDIYLCNLQANIISNGTAYTVYLASQIEDDGNTYYKVLDITYQK